MTTAALATPLETALAGPPLDVAVLSYGLPTPGLKRGGIERVAHELAEGLAARGHQGPGTFDLHHA